MKKYVILFVLSAIAVFFSYCSSSKKATAAPVAKTTYETNVKSLVETSCSPCHIPAKGGRKKPLDTYASIRENIDDIIRRVELNPTDRGFMPFKNAKLSDSAINIFKQFKTDGLLEK